VLRARVAPAVEGLAPGVLDPDRLVVGTADGALELIEVQPEGRAPQRAADWRNGARPRPGERLGDGPPR
jgi:methionyl-tRNA formyltransferase